jgi:hypothetical protein
MQVDFPPDLFAHNLHRSHFMGSIGVNIFVEIVVCGDCGNAGEDETLTFRVNRLGVDPLSLSASGAFTAKGIVLFGN